MNAFTYRFEPVARCDMCGGEEARIVGRRLNAHQGIRARNVVGIAVTVVRCSSCGLVYANPRPIPDTLAQHYNRPPEDYWRSDYFEQDVGYFDAHVATFRRLWHGHGTPRALDVGAGLGKTMKSLARHGFDTFGLEPSITFRERALGAGVDSARLQLASIEQAEYVAEAFDLVSFGAVLEHLQSPADALTRALELTAPGGLIYVEVPSANWLMARLLNRAHRLQGRDYVTNLSPMHPPFHLYEFTLDSFEHHARRASYEMVDHRFYVCETFLPKQLRPIARWIMGPTDSGMQLEVWLRK